MSNTSINLAGLDFEIIKNNLIDYLKKSDTPFKDVNFEGSNISHLIDVLSYNTYLNAFYLNMVASEMFLDTAQLRESVVSHAKELNYVPRSFTSASALINFTITPSSPIDSVIIPRGTTFSSKLGSNTYTFSTNQNYVFNNNSNNQIEVVDLEIFEGTLTSDAFVYDASNTTQRFVLSNPTIDTNSLTLRVVENNGANIEIYTRASSFIGLTSTSKIYFLQAAENSQYEIVFGDGVIGRKPLSGSVIIAEYRICNGELPNGTSVFDNDGPIQGQATISTIFTSKVASGGSINESIENIKFNAPRYYQNQERAITTLDYENLVRSNFPEVQAISAFGGEEADPPQYGKVFIALDVQDADGIPETLSGKISTFIKARSPLSIEPVIVQPDFLYVRVVSDVDFNINITSLTESDIETFVKNTISNYNITELSNFKKTIRYSTLVKNIDDSHASIISNSTKLEPYKVFTPTSKNVSQTFSLNYGFPLSEVYKSSNDDYRVFGQTLHNVTSSKFILDNKEVFIEDDGFGIIYLVSLINQIPTRLLDIGTVDYTAGVVRIVELAVQNYTGEGVEVFVIPKNLDILSTQNTIINIKDNDLIINAIPVRV